MATGKKSFLIYCDYIHLFEKLSDIEAGLLIKHIFAYVNDLNPTAPDKLTEIAFEPIKQQLKRDLKDWEQIREKRSEAGKASAEKRQQNQQVLTSVESVEQTSTNPTVIVNDIVNVTDNVNKKKAVFSKPTLIEVTSFFIKTENAYNNPIIAENESVKFWNYYESNGWQVGKNKMKDWNAAARMWIARNKTEAKPEKIGFWDNPLTKPVSKHENDKSDFR